MMKGTNKLRLNQATMQEIVNRWIDDEFKTEQLTVADVDYEPATRTFMVTVEAATQDEPQIASR